MLSFVFANKILLFISALIGVSSVTNNTTSQNWTIEQTWLPEGDFYVFKAHSSQIVADCKKNPQALLLLPRIIQSSHTIYAGEQKLLIGDPQFKQATSFYQQPRIKCSEIKTSTETLIWEVRSYSQYFARVNNFPYVTQSQQYVDFYSTIINVLASGILFFMALFIPVIFFGKIDKKLICSLWVGCMGIGIYSMMCSADLYNVEINMLQAHKIADASLWIGILGLIYSLYYHQIFNALDLKLVSVSVVFGMFFILLGSNGDVVQLGTTMAFPALCFVFTKNLIIQLREIFTLNHKLDKFNQILPVLFFILAGYNDIFLVVGLTDSTPIFSLGVLSALMTSAFLVNAKINLTYRERDNLLQNLELRVAERTKDLDQALREKELAQAELIQNEKLASLGTLSAGIAHEINNSINYVNACAIGLEREIKKNESAYTDKVKNLLLTIKHGAQMTIDIVASLRNYTGLNQAKRKEASISQIINSIRPLINKKLGAIQLVMDLTDDPVFDCNLVGLNQIFMNLLTNAIDAVDPEGGKIIISSKLTGSYLQVSIKDNGPGILEKNRTKIFDPFFTTKEVGSGTGLGLHIAKQEIEKEKGSLSLVNSDQDGAEFIIRIPLFSSENKNGAA